MFSFDLFLLDYDKIHKKQKFSALDIVESCSKEMWSISYVTCVEKMAQVSLTPWSIFLFLDVLTLKLCQPKIILSTVRRIKN